MPDLRPYFTEQTAASTRPCLRLTPVTTDPELTLDPDTIRLLRDGLGHYDMEIRWLAHLDQSNVLRLWRSWTGLQIYEATVDVDRGTITGLGVEQDGDRYRGSLAAEPAQFARILCAVVNTLRHFRAGHTPYGPAENADPLPSDWPPRRG